MSPTWSILIYPHQAFLFTWWELVTCSFLLYLKIFCSKNARVSLPPLEVTQQIRSPFISVLPRNYSEKRMEPPRRGALGSEVPYMETWVTPLGWPMVPLGFPNANWKNALDIDQAMIRGGLAKSRRTLQGKWGMGRGMGKQSQPGIKHQISLLTLERGCM